MIQRSPSVFFDQRLVGKLHEEAWGVLRLTKEEIDEHVTGLPALVADHENDSEHRQLEIQELEAWRYFSRKGFLRRGKPMNYRILEENYPREHLITGK